jgi:hypothetical protein
MEPFSYASNPHACTSTASLISSCHASNTSTYTLDNAEDLTSNICKSTDEGSEWYTVTGLAYLIASYHKTLSLR